MCSSCSYAYLTVNNADLTGAPAALCTNDSVDMDSYLSCLMTMSPASLTSMVSPLSKEKRFAFTHQFYTLFKSRSVFVCWGAAHSLWLSEKSSCFYNAVAALYVAE